MLLKMNEKYALKRKSMLQLVNHGEYQYSGRNLKLLMQKLRNLLQKKSLRGSSCCPACQPYIHCKILILLKLISEKKNKIKKIKINISSSNVQRVRTTSKLVVLVSLLFMVMLLMRLNM